MKLDRSIRNCLNMKTSPINPCSLLSNPSKLSQKSSICPINFFFQCRQYLRGGAEALNGTCICKQAGGNFWVQPFGRCKDAKDTEPGQWGAKRGHQGLQEGLSGKE